jgi:putative endonuclease
VQQHRLGTAPGFTKKYKVDQLVYFEMTSEVLAALAREKEIKGWTRAKKVALIERWNPDWRDLSVHGIPEDSSLRSE